MRETAIWIAMNNRTNPYMLSRRAGREGFTLIELMISAIIIAILAGISIGLFHFVKESAYRVTMQHDLKISRKHKRLMWQITDDIWAPRVISLTGDHLFQVPWPCLIFPLSRQRESASNHLR